MTLKLTPELLQVTYDLLSLTRPFNKWNLPDSSDIIFKVAKSRREHGWFSAGPDGRMEIVASSALTGHMVTLLGTMAHEKIHLHQYRTGMPINHGPAFKKLAQEVCKYHRDFDPKAF